ncbi:hypothetical protein P8452_74567 [Trifolium repens]|nr:hypothetical protein P8452_74567 [Trifolium repens]
MAVELVGGALLSAFLQVTFEKLASAGIQDYFRARKLNDKLLNKLNITLLTDDAELKQIRNPNVRAWLDAVKDAVLDAEDLLEEIDIEVFRCKQEAESQSNTTANKVKRTISVKLWHAYTGREFCSLNGYKNIKLLDQNNKGIISVKILLQTLTEMKDKTDTVFALPDEFLSKGFLSFVAFAYSKSGNTKATSNMLEEILLGGG